MLRTYFQQLKNNGTGIKIYFDMIICTLKYGASPNNYKDFNFKNLNRRERATYVTNGLSRKLIKKFNKSDYIDIFENKVEFAKRFSDYFGREWVSTSNISYDGFFNFIKNKKRIIYKPIDNAQGRGIRVFDDLSNPKKLYDEVKCGEKSAILEDWILQHEIFNNIYDKAINCVRIITLCDNNTVDFLAGGVTWGNGMNIANASASGIVSPLNFNTGILDKPAADFQGGIYYKHPVTGANLVGVQIPYWNEIKEMLTCAAKEIPQVAYIGWDVAITPNRPIIIEGNTTPGYKYYQIPVHMDNKMGNRSIYEIHLKNK